MFRHAPLDLFDRDGVPRFFLENIFQQMLDHLVGQLFAAEGRERRHAHERALEPAHIRANAIGQEFENFIAQFDLKCVRFLSQDGHARFHIGWLQLRRQSPFET